MGENAPNEKQLFSPYSDINTHASIPRKNSYILIKSYQLRKSEKISTDRFRVQSTSS